MSHHRHSYIPIPLSVIYLYSTMRNLPTILPLADPKGVPGTRLPRSKCFNFPYSFRYKCGQIIMCWHPSLSGPPPPSGKFWIRHTISEKRLVHMYYTLYVHQAYVMNVELCYFETNDVKNRRETISVNDVH